MGLLEISRDFRLRLALFHEHHQSHAADSHIRPSDHPVQDQYQGPENVHHRLLAAMMVADAVLHLLVAVDLVLLVKVPLLHLGTAKNGVRVYHRPGVKDYLIVLHLVVVFEEVRHPLAVDEIEEDAPPADLSLHHLGQAPGLAKTEAREIKTEMGTIVEDTLPQVSG